jgi:glycosyltransferase involved in cell wall biosynthesis
MEIVTSSSAQDIEYEILYLDDLIEVTPPCPYRQVTGGQWNSLDSFDIVHAHCLRPELYVLVARMLHRSRYKIVTTVHGTSDEDYAYQFGRLAAWWIFLCESIVWRSFDAIVVLSTHARHHYQSRFRLLRRTLMHVVENGFRRGGQRPDNVIVRKFERATPDEFTVGVCAGLIRRKGIEQLVGVLSREPRMRLFILGSGPEEQNLRSLADSLGVSDRALFMGFVNAPYLYAADFDAYCLPSRSEGQPMSLIEAAAFGANLVCSDIPAHRAMFDESSATFFRLDDLASLSEALSGALADSKRKRAGALREYRSRFDARLMTEAYENLYRRLAKGTSRVRSDQGE